MEPIWLITFLVALAVGLIAVDFFLPGFILGSVGVVLMLVALVLCHQRYGVNWTAVLFIAEVVIGVAGAYISIRYGPETRTGKKMILGYEQTAQHAGAHPALDLIGQKGTAHTLLRPSGTVTLGDKRLDVIAESGIIERGSAIQVVAIDGDKIIVRKI